MAFKYTQDLIKQGSSYADYRNMILNQLAEQDSASESARKLLKYTAKNEVRMSALDQRLTIIPQVHQAIKNAKPVIWLVLTEGWCGDAASSVPVIARIAALYPEKIELRFLLRDENPDLMDAHLTNGGKSIPKLIMLDESLSFLNSWGPRPQELQNHMESWKTEYEHDFKGLIEKVNAWYDEDQSVAIQVELAAMLVNRTASQQTV